jgi:hypothetical protein
MNDDLHLHGHGILRNIARRGINPTAIHTKAAQSRLAHFSGLRTNSTVVYHRAGNGRVTRRVMCGIMP